MGAFDSETVGLGLMSFLKFLFNQHFKILFIAIIVG